MPFPFQIFQSDKAFAIAYEYAGAFRNVYLKDPGPPQVDTWMGQSVGRWEGDTFVVDANGFNDQSWFDRAGNHHSETLKVTERYTMTDRRSHPVRSHDRGSATRSRGRGRSACRSIGASNAGARLGQFKCVEFVEELMYGHLRKEPVK